MTARKLTFMRRQFESAGFRRIEVATVEVTGFEDGKAARLTLTLEALPGDQGEVRVHLVDENGPAKLVARTLKRRAARKGGVS